MHTFSKWSIFAFVAFIIYIIVRVETTDVEHFTQQPAAIPKYEKELNLFKSLSTSEQEDYLGLSREDKLSKYGKQLL